MITTAMLAEYFQNALNALVPSDGGYEFKIWAEAGEYKRYYRQGNEVVYYINGQLSVAGSALTPNALVMGTNGLTLEFLVPADTPKTSYNQTDEDLARVKSGQFYFIQQVSQLLLNYFTAVKKLSMADSDGTVFNMTAYSGVAISGVIDINTIVGVAMPMTVSMTLNFGEELISGLDISVYMDGELVPYLTLTPSRAAQLTTDLQSNAVVQKHFATSSAYGVQFTSPSAVGNSATEAIYNYIANKDEQNMAHFVEVEWGEQRDDIYLALFTAANANVSGAEFAGLNASLGEAYQNEEYFTYPQNFGVGYFQTASSLGDELSFSLSASFTKTFAANKPVPDSYPLYYYIAGEAYKITATKTSQSSQEDGTTTATFSASAAVTTALNASDYMPYDDDNYAVYLIASESVTVSGATSGFTYTTAQ